MRTTCSLLFALLALLVSGTASRAQAQDGSAGSLDEARAFYASAEYDRALTVLERLAADETLGDARADAEFYRGLCLLALGREDEAARAVELLVTEHPTFRPAQELPPRVQALLGETRARLLPMVIQSRYLSARGAYDQRDFVAALKGFTETIELFAQPDVARLAGGPPLADLWILAEGFLELSAAALSPPEPQIVVQPLGEPTGPVAPVAPPQGPHLYSAVDRDVVPPAVIEQSIPDFPGPIRSSAGGVIEVVIDEQGNVASATMLESMGRRYDELALAAAKGWQYRPATLAGTPVHFVKRVRVSLIPSP